LDNQPSPTSHRIREDDEKAVANSDNAFATWVEEKGSFKRGNTGDGNPVRGNLPKYFTVPEAPPPDQCPLVKPYGKRLVLVGFAVQFSSTFIFIQPRRKARPEE
jgi:hypothetical protein